MSYLTYNKIQDNFDFEFNIIILGYSYVGKSCVVRRYLHDSFSKEHILVLGINRESKFIEINNKIVKINIYDKPNTSERYSPIPKKFFKRIEGAIIVYHISDFFYCGNMFDDVQKSIEEIKSNADLDTQIIIFQNKCDLDDFKKEFEIEEKVKKLANELGIKHFVVSAKTGYNINEGFNSLVNVMINRFKDPNGEYIKLKNGDDKNKKGKKKCA